MPVTFTIDVERRYVLTSVTGTVSVPEMHEYQERLRADPSFEPTFSNLMDFSGTTPFVATGEDIRRLSVNSPYGPGARRAMLVTRDLHFGFARMVQVFAGQRGVNVEIFRDRESALAWLGESGD